MDEAVGLKDRRDDEDEGIQDDTGCQQAHQPDRQGQLFPGVAAEEPENGLSQDDQTGGAGHGDQTHDPDAGFGHHPCAPAAAPGELLGDGGDGGDGDRGDEGAGHIEEGLAEVIDALHIVGGLGGKACRALEPGHIDRGVNGDDELHARSAEGDRDGDPQELLCRIAARIDRRVQAVLGVELGHGSAASGGGIDHRCQGADRDAKDRAAGGVDHAAGLLFEEPGRSKAEAELADGLQNLGNRGRDHVRLALEIAAVG